MILVNSEKNYRSLTNLLIKPVCYRLTCPRPNGQCQPD